MNKSADANSLIAEVCRNKADFVAFVITPWHYLSFLASLKYIEGAERRKINGVVAVLEHPDNGYLLDLKDLKNPFENRISFLYFADSVSKIEVIKTFFYKANLRFKKYKKTENAILVFSPLKPNFHICYLLSKTTNRDVVSIAIDEGVGTYLRNKAEWVGFQDNRSLSARIRFQINNVLFGERYERLLIKNGFLVRLFLYSKEDDIYKRNDFLSNRYAEVLNGLTQKGTKISNSKYVVICTQPLKEFSENADMYLSLLNDVISTFTNCGFKVFIKAHPREAVSFYDGVNQAIILRDSNKISFEEFLCGLDLPPKYVVGFTSTALITSECFFNIPTINISNIFSMILSNDTKTMIQRIEALDRGMTFVDNVGSLHSFLIGDDGE